MVDQSSDRISGIIPISFARVLIEVAAIQGNPARNLSQSESIMKFERTVSS